MGASELTPNAPPSLHMAAGQEAQDACPVGGDQFGCGRSAGLGFSRTVSRFEESAGATVTLARIDDPLQALRRRTLDIAVVRSEFDVPRGARTLCLFHEPRIADAPSTALRPASVS
ncbi:hypothetical protein ACQEV4_16640 [Streptomyces shenzhenensis]|uniref:hypothetical protein n=1 Tax=Streptomyces shenzhenensis TaxID=943815 RepID=UPI003D89DFE3